MPACLAADVDSAWLRGRSKSGRAGADRAEQWAGSQEACVLSHWTRGPRHGSKEEGCPPLVAVSKVATWVVLELDGWSPPCDLISELCFLVYKDLGGRCLAQCGDRSMLAATTGVSS